MNTCKDESCKAVNGKGHSDECIKQHDKAAGVPDCFDRAIDNRNGGGFDNCMFSGSCKQAKPICWDNPVTLK